GGPAPPPPTRAAPRFWPRAPPRRKTAGTARSTRTAPCCTTGDCPPANLGRTGPYGAGGLCGQAVSRVGPSGAPTRPGAPTPRAVRPAGGGTASDTPQAAPQ